MTSSIRLKLESAEDASVPLILDFDAENGQMRIIGRRQIVPKLKKLSRKIASIELKSGKSLVLSCISKTPLLVLYDDQEISLTKDSGSIRNLKSGDEVCFLPFKKCKFKVEVSDIVDDSKTVENENFIEDDESDTDYETDTVVKEEPSRDETLNSLVERKTRILPAWMLAEPSEILAENQTKKQVESKNVKHYSSEEDVENDEEDDYGTAENEYTINNSDFSDSSDDEKRQKSSRFKQKRKKYESDEEYEEDETAQLDEEESASDFAENGSLNNGSSSNLSSSKKTKRRGNLTSRLKKKSTTATIARRHNPRRSCAASSSSSKKRRRTSDDEFIDDDDGGDGNDEDKSSKISPSKTSQEKNTREPCVYGAKCYRKNVLHKKEFSHPGDSDFTSTTEIEEKSSPTRRMAPRRKKIQISDDGISDDENLKYEDDKDFSSSDQDYESADSIERKRTKKLRAKSTRKKI